jgi:ABC-2 type transport system permease protein
MIKYFHIARIALNDHMSHKVRQATRFMVFALQVTVMVIMWRMIYQFGYGPPEISFTNMSWYLGLAQMVLFLSPRLVSVIDEDIRSGDVAYFLTRPLPYFWVRFSEGAGSLVGMCGIYFTLGTAFIYLLAGGWPDSGVTPILVALPCLFTANLIHLLFQLCCGLSAFWTHEANTVYYAYQKMFLLLGGCYMPLSLYPWFLSGDILKFLPFSAMMNGPCSLVFADHLGTAWIQLIFLQIFWCGMAGLLAHKTYNICLRRMEINGG